MHEKSFYIDHLIFDLEAKRISFSPISAFIPWLWCSLHGLHSVCGISPPLALNFAFATAVTPLSARSKCIFSSVTFSLSLSLSLILSLTRLASYNQFSAPVSQPGLLHERERQRERPELHSIFISQRVIINSPPPLFFLSHVTSLASSRSLYCASWDREMPGKRYINCFKGRKYNG